MEGTRLTGLWKNKTMDGKSTTSVNLAAGLCEQESGALVVDLNSQDDTSTWIVVRDDRTGGGRSPEGNCGIRQKEQ